MKWRHERRSRHGRARFVPFVLVHGIHRRVVSFLLVALALGLASGIAVAHLSWGWSALVVVGAGLAFWPLSAVATFRIAHPVSELARIAQELRSGQLQSRASLATGREDEVGVVAGTLRSMADRVAKQLADQRALLAAVSHELRSPLGRIRVMVELSREGVGPPSFHDDLQKEVDGMDALVADLLAAARIDFEAVSPVPLDAEEVVRRALSVGGFVDTLLDVGQPGLRVNADPTLASRALVVLLDNAVRHGGSAVRVGLCREGDEVRFEVDDDGPGFGPGEEVQAFQPFWRRPGTTADGHGLGLALVRQIVEAHGGAAGAGNRPGGGARVWMTLPCEGASVR